MDEGDSREQIRRLEDRIEELAEAMERCRKIALISKVAIAIGGASILAMLIGAIRLDAMVMLGAIAAGIGGIVMAGSNRSTAQETAAALQAAEADRARLIGEIDLRVVSELDSGSLLPPA